MGIFEGLRRLVKYTAIPDSKTDQVLLAHNDIILSLAQTVILCIGLFQSLKNDCNLRYSGKFSIMVNYSIHMVLKVMRIALIAYACYYAMPGLVRACSEVFFSYDY